MIPYRVPYYGDPPNLATLINNSKKNWHRQNKLERIDDTEPSLIEAPLSIERYFNLARYLMRDAWRDDFLIITGIYEVCGGYLFNIYPRKLILDVATIENVSSNKIHLSGITLTESAGGLRLAKTLTNRVPKTIEYSVELAPREKALLPLRMTWPTPSGLSDLFGDSDKGKSQIRHRTSEPSGEPCSTLEKAEKNRDAQGS